MSRLSLLLLSAQGSVVTVRLQVCVCACVYTHTHTPMYVGGW